MIFTNGNGLKMILTAASIVLFTAAAPLFSSPDSALDYNTLISRAASLPAANGMKMLDSLSRVKDASGAQALRLLGDHAFIKEDYKKAAVFYKQASQVDSISIYRHLHALAAVLDGQTAIAKEIWNTIADDLSDSLSTLSALHIAYLEMQAQNWEEAYLLLKSAAPADTASPLYIPFVWEMLECSKVMNRSERIAFHEKQLAVFKGHILEGGTASFQQNVSTAVNAINVNAEKPQTAAVKNDDKKETPPQNRQKANFAIQVGAFGSKDNAENLVRRLSENYSDVIILPPAIGGPVLYRVRVGSFVSREEADITAQKLSAAGISSPRVVEK